jgi:putative transposase
MEKPKTFYLPRLDPLFYRGDAVVQWTMTMFDRATGWLSPQFHTVFRELMLHAAAREDMLCPVYCLMPDHLHFVWMGLQPESDQRNGAAFLRRYLKPLLLPHKLQVQAHDHVLGEDERKRNAFAKICFYILENPVKAGLASQIKDWEFCGSIIPGYPTLHSAQRDFWEKFWKIYAEQRNPLACCRKLPRRSPSQS